jgi:hypothetical protein
MVSIPLCQRFSLRSVKGIALGALVCTVFAFLFFWQPAYLRLRSLQKEIAQEQHDLKPGETLTKTPIPTMDQLPDMIERCRSRFEKEGVNVVALNVERFGERRETGNVESLDYSLVRLHLRGNWEGIVASLTALEETQEGSIHVPEAVLDAAGGEVLFQMYYCTGE